MAIKIAQWPVAIALVLLGFALVYFFAPDVKEQKWHWITPGAIAGVGLWLAVSFALKIYLHFFDRYSATYGSLVQSLFFYCGFTFRVLRYYSVQKSIQSSKMRQRPRGSQTQGKR